MDQLIKVSANFLTHWLIVFWHIPTVLSAIRLIWNDFLLNDFIGWYSLCFPNCPIWQGHRIQSKQNSFWPPYFLFCGNLRKGCIFRMEAKHLLSSQLTKKSYKSVVWYQITSLLRLSVWKTYLPTFRTSPTTLFGSHAYVQLEICIVKCNCTENTQ